MSCDSLTFSRLILSYCRVLFESRQSNEMDVYRDGGGSGSGGVIDGNVKKKSIASKTRLRKSIGRRCGRC